MNEDTSLRNIILPNSRVNKWEKDELLNIESRESAHKSGLGINELKNALYIMIFILALCVPKVYLSNSIYYLSKDIANLQTQHDILLNENKHLKHEVEALRYKFLILRDI